MRNPFVKWRRPFPFLSPKTQRSWQTMLIYGDLQGTLNRLTCSKRELRNDFGFSHVILSMSSAVMPSYYCDLRTLGRFANVRRAALSVSSSANN